MSLLYRASVRNPFQRELFPALCLDLPGDPAGVRRVNLEGACKVACVFVSPLSASIPHVLIPFLYLGIFGTTTFPSWVVNCGLGLGCLIIADARGGYRPRGRRIVGGHHTDDAVVVLDRVVPGLAEALAVQGGAICRSAFSLLPSGAQRACLSHQYHVSYGMPDMVAASHSEILSAGRLPNSLTSTGSNTKTLRCRT